MASSLETNKILAAVLTAGICASGAGVISRILYHPTVPEEPSYIIEVAVEGEDAGGEGDGGGEVLSVAALLASADVAGGESGAKKCTACHGFDEGGDNKIGPNLYGIVGRDIASSTGFAYSDALSGMDGSWDYEALDGFLADPKGWAPGTKMAYAGMRSAEDRADLILYLRSLAAEPLPLPEVEAGETETAGEAEGGESETEAADAADATEETAAAGEDAAAEGTVEEAADEAAAAAEEVVEEAADATGEVAEGAEAAAEEAGEAVTDAATEAAEDAEAVATDAAEAAGEAAEGAEEQAADAAEAVSEAADGAAMSGLVAMIAEGDVAQGEKVSKKCKACHVFEEGGANKLGPALWGIVGRDIGASEGFKYSGALSDMEGAWTYENLDAFLAAPKSWAPGTKMAFAGVKKEQDRADLIAYLRSLDAEPAPLQ